MIKLTFILFLLLISSCDQQTEDEHYDNYRPLRVSVSQVMPVNILTKLPDGTYRYQGIVSRHFYYVAQKIKRPLVVVVPSDEEVMKYGRTQASFNQVVNGVADVSAMPMSIEAEQLNLVDITFPAMMNSFKMLVPAAKEESRLLSFLRPFQPMVWLILFVSLAGSVIAASGLDWFYNLRMNRQQRDHQGVTKQRPFPRPFSSFLIKYSIYTIGIVTNHAYHNPFTRNGLRIFGALWLLVMTVMVYAYSGLLIGCLTVPLMTKSIETLEDVAASTEVVLRINPKELSGLGKAVMEGKSGVWKALRDQLRRRPDGLYTDFLSEADFSPLHQNYATPSPSNHLASIIRQVYKKEKKCRYHLTESIPFSVRYLYMLRKNDEDNGKINVAIMELREYGLLDYYANDALYIPGSRESDQCFKKQKKSAKEVPIKLVDLTSAFFILGIGTGLSILCFLLELIVAKYKHEMKRRSAVVTPVAHKAANAGNQSDESDIQLDNNKLNKSFSEAAVKENDDNAIEVVTEIF